MATAATVDLGPSHAPKEEARKAFNEIELELKKTLQHLRHETNKHEPAYFAAVHNLSDKKLTNFSTNDLKEVRIAKSSYGLHLLGKVILPESAPASSCYFMFRAFIPGEADTAKLHCIHMQEIENADESKTFKAIFFKDDALEWFDT